MATTLTQPLIRLARQFESRTGHAPVLGIDHDGTIADMVGGLRPIVAKALGITKDEWRSRLPQPDEYAMWLGRNHWFASKADFLDHFRAAELAGFYRHLPIYDKAAVSLRQLHDAGFELVTITARSADFNDDTRSWQKAHTLPAPLLTILNSGMEKHQVEGLDIVIDDAPSVIEGLLAAGRPVVIYDQDYNQDIPEHPLARRAFGWGPSMHAAIADLLEVIPS
jgi:uncharacterized HAD superfamily protein